MSEIKKLESDDPAIEYGTSLQGLANVSYEHIVKVFGEPTFNEPSGDNKMEVEWYLQTPAGIATIYNYKDGVSYLGEEDGTPVEEIRDWHIGGKDDSVVPYVIEALSGEEENQA